MTKKESILDKMATLGFVDPEKEAAKKRERQLIDLGYNQALLDHGIPEGMTRQEVERVVARLRQELGM